MGALLQAANMLPRLGSDARAMACRVEGEVFSLSPPMEALEVQS